MVRQRSPSSSSYTAASTPISSSVRTNDTVRSRPAVPLGHGLDNLRGGAVFPRQGGPVSGAPICEPGERWSAGDDAVAFEQ